MGKIIGDEGWISLGPWGGDYGSYHIYKLGGPIMHITIHYGDRVINSILFESKSLDGVLIGSSVKIGSNDGDAAKKVTIEEFSIESSEEQLTFINVTYVCIELYEEVVALTSLCFKTNLKTYGPYGSGSGEISKSMPIEGGFIVGFHGYGGSYNGESFVTAIGVIVAPKVDSFPYSEKNVNCLHSIQDSDSVPTQLKDNIIKEEGCISLGPWGGKDGVDWIYKPDGPLLQISICYGEAINSILFKQRSCDGFVIGSSEKIGGTGGHKTEMFCIDRSVEQFLSINMEWENYNGQPVITSIGFVTNLKKYGPFGESFKNERMSIPMEGGAIVGFHGRHSGTCLTAIGVFVAPKVNNLLSSKKKSDSLVSIQDPDYASTQLKAKALTICEGKENSAPEVKGAMERSKEKGKAICAAKENEIVAHQEGKITSEEGWMPLGPWGGKDGVDWACKANGPAMHISICYGEAINSILFQSRSCDGLVIGSSQKLGGTGGRTTETFCVDTSEEQLTSISLTYNYFHGKVRITTLCFNTNLNKYGPFGSRPGHYSESIPIERGVFGGFHGRTYGRYITAIGIFVAPEVSSLHSIQDPDSTPIQPKVLGSDVGSKPKTLETPTIKPKWSSRFLVAKSKAIFRGSKTKTLENIIIHNAASSNATTNKDDHHCGAPSPSSEMIPLATSKVDYHGEAPSLSTEIIPLATNIDNHNGGALSSTSKKIQNDLILLEKAIKKAQESVGHLKYKIDQADEKFQELQTLASSERNSDELQKADSDKKEIQKAIAKLNVHVLSLNKLRSADSKPRHRNWDNINGADDGMTHFFHKEPEVAQTGDFDGILKAFHDLQEPLQDCLLCFFKFPPMATIKRSPMIYLWIGQGYVSQYLQSEGYVWDVEVHANKIFDELIAKDFIQPIYQNCSLVPDSCKMSPFVRSSLYQEAELRGFTSNGPLDLDPASVCGNLIRRPSCLINVGEAIINFQHEIFERMTHIRSLYLGRWQCSATHHIELENAKIFHGLNKLKSLTFLSLRGISMITELPTFITELHNLMILDLRACHNLEVVPNKIGLLKNLTHLDISECCLLEHMPKSLAQLSNLQVLKGFVIGDFNNDNQSCTLLDLSGLQKLRKLNIHISVKDLLRLQDLGCLERFEGLKKLTISWGKLQARAKVIAEASPFGRLPPRLQKLDLQCFPMTNLTNWLMPGELKELKKLYIRGGKLRDLGEILKCQVKQLTVEILRLEYLSELELHWKELRTLFPKLIYLHQVECPNFMDFPSGVWINEMAVNTSVQLQKYYNRTNGMVSSNSMGSGSESDSMGSGSESD